MNQVRVGIVGYGVVGRKRHAMLNSIDGAEVVSICDRRSIDQTTLSSGISIHRSYEDVLQDDIDALFVCLSTDMLAQVTAAGLKSNLHVFCEKPPARTLQELDEVRRLERKNPDQILRYGFNHRRHGSVEDAYQIISNNRMGKVLNIRGIYGKSKNITFDQSDWRTKKAIAGGGILLDQGIHLVDLVRLFGGEFKVVGSLVSNSFWRFDVEDNAYALLESDSGVVAMLHSSATQWKHRFRLEVTLEKGAIELSGILTDSKSYGEETLRIIDTEQAESMGNPKVVLKEYKQDVSWKKETEEFIKEIRGKPVESVSTVTEAYKTLELVMAIYSAADKI